MSNGDIVAMATFSRYRTAPGAGTLAALLLVLIFGSPAYVNWVGSNTDAGSAGGWFMRLPAGATKTFELDPIGKMVWEQCDGKTSVQQIIRKLSKFCRITPAEAKPATLSFLQMLGKKGLIGFATKDRKNKDEG